MRGAQPSDSPLRLYAGPANFTNFPAPVRLAWVLLIAASGAVGLLHLVEPAIDPYAQPLSFYVHGRHGWLLPLALGAFGSAALVLRWGWAATPTGARAARWLTPFGLGMMVAALVPADPWFPWEGPVSLAGSIHAVVAVVAPPFLLGAMWSLRRAGKIKRRTRAGLNAFALAYLAGLVASALSLAIGFISDRAPPFIGLTERLLAFAAVGWLAIAARSFRR